MTRTPLKVGDRVCWSASFLRNIQDYTAATANRRGKIVDVDEPFHYPRGLLRVQWDDGPEHWCLFDNLWDATRLHLEPR